MARLLGPAPGSRYAYLHSGAPAADAPAVVYSDAAATVLADIRAYDGSVTPGAVVGGSMVTYDGDGQSPQYWFPDGLVDRVWVRVDGGPAFPVDADHNPRIGRLDAMVLPGADGRVLTADAAQPYGVKWALPATDATRSLYTSGQYYYPWSPDTSGTSLTLANGTLRLVPVLFPTAVVISRIGVEVTAAGDAASVFRPEVYADDGTGYPGALLLDGGALSTATTGFKEATVSTTLSGLVWIGGAVQGVTTVQPTLRVGFERPVVPLRVGATITNVASYGYGQTSVTGTPPATFTTTVAPISQAPRLFIKVA